MRKKILVVTDNLKDQVNGVVTTFKNIESHARNDGIDIVYLDPGQFSYCDAPGYPEVKLSWPSGIGKKIEALDPEHIHIATEGPLGFAARLYCDRKGYKIQYQLSHQVSRIPKEDVSRTRVPNLGLYALVP